MDYIASILKLEQYVELLPILLIGLIAGALNYLSADSTGFKHAIKFACMSAFISSCVFALTSATELPYMARVGIAASVGYFGIDRAIEIVKNIFSIKK